MDALSTLSTLSQTIAQAEDLQMLGQAIYQSMVQLRGPLVSFAIFQFDPISGQVKVVYWRESGKEQQAEPFQPTNNLLGRVLQNGETILWEKNQPIAPNICPALYGQRFARSLLAVALKTGSEIRSNVCGAVVLQDYETENLFGSFEIQLLNVIGSILAARLQTHDLLANTQRQVQQGHQLYEITSKIRTSTDFQTILATTAQELSKALGIRRVHISLDAAQLMRAQLMRAQQVEIEANPENWEGPDGSNPNGQKGKAL